MSTSRASAETAAARHADVRSGQAVRRPKSQVLDRVVSRLDRLAQDESVASTSSRESDRRIAEAEAVCAELLAAYRGPPAKRAHPPLGYINGVPVW